LTFPPQDQICKSRVLLMPKRKQRAHDPFFLKKADDNPQDPTRPNKKQKLAPDAQSNAPNNIKHRKPRNKPNRNQPDEKIDETLDKHSLTQEEGVQSEEENEYKSILYELPFEDRSQIQKYDNSYDQIKNASLLFKDETKRLSKLQKERKRTASMPPELSAKLPVSRKRVVVPVTKKIIRDPRFDSLSGTFNEDLFKKTYGFLHELRGEEKEILRKQITTEKDPDMKQKLERGLEIMEQRERAEKRKEQRQKIIKEFRNEEMIKVAEGKTPFHLKQSSIRNMELKHKYVELQQQGKLDSYLKRKRKKLGNKERRKMPAIRTRNQVQDEAE